MGVAVLAGDGQSEPDPLLLVGVVLPSVERAVLPKIDEWSLVDRPALVDIVRLVP